MSVFTAPTASCWDWHQRVSNSAWDWSNKHGGTSLITWLGGWRRRGRADCSGGGGTRGYRIYVPRVKAAGTLDTDTGWALALGVGRPGRPHHSARGCGGSRARLITQERLWPGLRQVEIRTLTVSEIIFIAKVLCYASRKAYGCMFVVGSGSW